MKQLIKNVHILTMDSDWIEYKDGYLLIEENRISQMGEMSDSLPSADKIIDGKQGILLPGMINTHTHTGMIPFRSLGDDVPDRLRRFLFPLEQVMTPELVRASAEYAMAEMLLSGVTAFCDMYYFEDEVAQAAEAMKVRALLGETIIDMATCDAENAAEALAYCESFIQKWQNHEMITPVIAPHAPNTNDQKTLEAIVALSRKYDAPITMHVSEMTYEMEEFAEQYNQTPVAFLEELGYFDQEFIMAHCIFMTEEDMQLTQKYRDNVRIAHCIGANTKSAKGVAPVRGMLEHQLTVGLGTDGPSSGNTLDLFTQMRMFANFHKTHLADRGAFPAREIVRLATVGGAKTLGLFDQVGSLEIGKKADIIIVETNSANMFPIFDPYSALVYSANASNISDVWVNGQQLVKEKQLVQADVQQIRETLYQQMDRFVVEAKRRAAEI
ncbi:amidohydrolase [Enterococcus sp. 669A]|uniref:Amidohydrolase n=1 Tax=Candidatus Enterococcus moelleringii TaxID=2815325 RepID=A0ABS3L9G4_9ENTE|nr:amidohydrolase [Enterococcus sp. 669A]MBO1305089.1 amidohydrolase [Enterococcus sp. 669A]